MYIVIIMGKLVNFYISSVSFTYIKIDGKGSLRHHCILGLSECFYYFLSHERQNSSAKDGVDPLHLVLFCFIIAFIAQSIEHSL